MKINIFDRQLVFLESFIDFVECPPYSLNILGDIEQDWGIDIIWHDPANLRCIFEYSLVVF